MPSFSQEITCPSNFNFPNCRFLLFAAASPPAAFRCLTSDFCFPNFSFLPFHRSLFEPVWGSLPVRSENQLDTPTIQRLQAHVEPDTEYGKFARHQFREGRKIGENPRHVQISRLPVAVEGQEQGVDENTLDFAPRQPLRK
jgi:hypothetical protein